LILVITSLAGCGPSRPPLYAAKGTVHFDGKPAANAVVWLHPVEKEELGGPRPHATVGPDGSFELSTYNTGDGAHEGKYRVSVLWYKAPERGDDQGKSLLPARYAHPKESGLPIVEIKPEPTQLPPLNLTR
jgi:hypothetical protein